MMSKDLESAMAAALNEARERQHEYLCVEHLLYTLLQDERGAEILENCGIERERLRARPIRLLAGRPWASSPGETTEFRNARPSCAVRSILPQ